MSLDHSVVAAYVDHTWGSDIVPVLHDYIRIPNVSVAYDRGWAEAGHMARATELLRQWCADRVDNLLKGATVEVCELAGCTPLLLVEVPATGGGSPDRTVLMYGHLDKQPPFSGWRPGLGPWEPVLEGDRLYGRGAADDGYAVFSALSALEAIRVAGGEHDRVVVLIEASEESGSPDLPAHLAALGDRLGEPALVVTLDSWCRDWDRLWVTTSLRGLVDLTLRVEVLREGIHSGSAGGVVPSSFRILRQLVGRIEDEATGALLLPELHVEVPDHRRRQIAETAAELTDFPARFPFAGDTQPMGATVEEMLLASTWGPALEIVGLEGAPPPAEAGNVLRPATAAKLSVRMPPTGDAQEAAAALVRRLTEDPPHRARVTVAPGTAEPGWHAPPEPRWLLDAVDAASTAAFGLPHRSSGEGGTIPFMGMLGRRFPDARFLITGVLGPGSNAHGPNEFLHLPTARNVTAAVAHIVDAQADAPDEH